MQPGSERMESSILKAARGSLSFSFFGLVSSLSFSCLSLAFILSLPLFQPCPYTSLLIPSLSFSLSLYLSQVSIFLTRSRAYLSLPPVLPPCRYEGWVFDSICWLRSPVFFPLSLLHMTTRLALWLYSMVLISYLPGPLDLRRNWKTRTKEPWPLPLPVHGTSWFQDGFWILVFARPRYQAPRLSRFAGYR